MGYIVRERDDLERGGLMPEVPSVEFRVLEERRITRHEVEAWLEDMSLPAGSELRVVGGILASGYSWRDVDLEFHAPKRDPCLCKELVHNLPSAEWNVHLFCKACGAVLRYVPGTNTWTWTWGPRQAEHVLAWPPGKRALTIGKIWELERRLEGLEHRPG